MKQIITLLLFLSTFCNAQVNKDYDLIIKNDKMEIKVKVVEIQDINIIYKKIENPDGPNYNIAKNQIFMILYANGTKETFDTPVPVTNYRSPAVANGTGTQSVNPVYAATPAPAQRPAGNQMLTSDFKYRPIRLVYNFSSDYDYAFTMLGDIPLSDVSNPQSSALSHFNLGIIFSGAGLSESYGGYTSDLTVMDIGVTINWYLPINKLTGSYKVNTGLFPFLYAGGVYRSTTLTEETFSDYIDTTDSTADFCGGAGLDWRFTRGFGLTFLYDYSYGAGAGIHFSF